MWEAVYNTTEHNMTGDCTCTASVAAEANLRQVPYTGLLDLCSLTVSNMQTAKRKATWKRLTRNVVCVLATYLCVQTKL